MKQKAISATLCISIMFSQTASANYITDHIKSVFGSNRVLANTTGGSTWKDPSTGVTYASGGSIVIKFRNSASYAPWFDGRAPQIHAGCESFSFDAGFASIIDLDGISDQLSSAGTSAVGGFVSSILYSTPILGSIIEYVKGIADQITAILENACNMGKALGTKTLDAVSSTAMADSVNGWVKDVKDSGVVKKATKFVTDHKNDFTKATDCLTKDDPVACYKGKGSKAKNNASTVEVAISAPIVKLNPTLQGTAGPLFSKLTFSKKKTDNFAIDRTTMAKYLGYENFSSERNLLKKSTIVEKYGKDILTMLLLKNPPTQASPSMCSALNKKFNSVKIGMSAEEKEKLVEAVKRSFDKNNNKVIQETTPSNGGFLPIKETKDGKETNYSPMFDFMDYISGGKNAIKLKIQNDYLYSVNTIETLDGDINASQAHQYIFLCPNSKTISPTYGGISSISNVEAGIEKIAQDKTVASGTTIIAEAAKIAKVLGKKYKIESNGELVLAPTINAHSIALLNNYILVSKLIDALNNADEFLNSSVGNGKKYVNVKSIEDLEQIKEKLKKNLNDSLGTENFMNAFMRDIKTVNDKYNLMKAKRTNSFGG